MLSNKSLGIAGAAMLGSVALLGTNAAIAAIDLDMTGEPLMFAEETVNTDMPVQGTDEMSYHRVTGEDTGATPAMGMLDIQAKIGVGATQDHTIRVEYTLTGMVFGGAVTADMLRVYDTSANQTVGAADHALAAGEAQVITGGGMGSKSVVFAISDQSTAIAQDDIVYLRVSVLGVSSEGGGVMMTARNLALGVEHMVSKPNAVVIKQAGTMTAMANSPSTYVERGYQDFGLCDHDGDTTNEDVICYHASLGSVSVSVASGALDATDGTQAVMSDVFGSAAVAVVTDDTTRTDALAGARITFDGMSSFAEFVYMGDADCRPSPETDVATRRDLVERDDGTNNGKLMPVAIADLGLGATPPTNHLCIEVPGGETGESNIAIPSTGPFNGKIAYVGGREATAMLGGIMRDGINIWLPYLTTHPSYRQRIIMVNDGDVAVRYMMEFVGENVMGGADSSGMLAANSTTLLNLSRDDVMTVDGGFRGAAQLIIEAEPGDVAVSTTLKNTMNGTIDTVVYTAE